MSIHVKFITRILNDWSKVILIFNSVSIISDHVTNKSIAIQSNSDFITHTHTTHTHTEGSIFISELLPLKLGVWPCQ